MFTPILDTTIGLVLVFLLTATLVSIITEMISGVMRLRAMALENTIAVLIEPAAAKPSSMRWLNGIFGAHAAALPESRAAVEQVRCGMKGKPLAPSKGVTGGTGNAGIRPALTYDMVYNHPLVGGVDSKNTPSYVPAANFSTALLHLLGRLGGGAGYQNIVRGVTGLPDGGLKTAMQALIMQAAGDMETLHKGVEDWFNHAMDQLSGDYKRFTGVVTFVIAFGLAIMFNIDALHVSQRLYSEPVLRKGTADAAAAQILKTDTLSQNFSQTEQALLVSEPVGWAGYKTWCDGHSASSWCAANGGLATLPARTWRLPTSWPYALMGWLVTALATMMGAPFWFDSLTRLVNLRNTGPKPKPSPDQ